MADISFQIAPTLYTYVLAIAAGVTFVLAIAVLRAGEQRIAYVLGALLLGSSVWSLSYGLQLASLDVAAARLWNGVRILCPPVISPLTFLFAAEYTGRGRWLRRRRVAALFSVAVVTLVLLLTNDVHNLVRGEMVRGPNGQFVGSTVGPWRLLYALFNFGLVFAALGMLVVAFRSEERSYRRQMAAIIVAVLVPTAVNLAWVLGVTPVDPTPIGFAVTGVTFAVALYRYRLLDIRPIARSTVFDTVDSGVYVTDQNGTIVDANTAAHRLLGDETDSLVGERLSSIFGAGLPAVFVQRLDSVRTLDERVEFSSETGRRWFDITASPIYDDTGRYVGRVVMVDDVTPRERQQRALQTKTRELERQNEHLEQVASFVSHDLRNPLNVAAGHLELARESGEERHFDVLENSLDRMDRLVDQMLDMARHGRSVTDTDPVDVAAVAASAWSMVDTGDATLEVDADRVVPADRERLLQLLENLFRNAVEHGGADSPSGERYTADLVVRVGDFDAGFYVEDTGPGIPESKREAVFEQGFTTGGDGAGLGLAIVRSAVRAHGWSISICESPEGGARFEISTDRDEAVEVT